MYAVTTLNRIREHKPCQHGWENLLNSLGKTKPDDEPLPLAHILESNDIADAIWALRAIDDCPEIRLFAVRCVRQVQHLITDERSLCALDVAELHAVGEATAEELSAAWAAARAAAWAAARSAAWAAAWAAAQAAAWAAALAAAWEDAARDAQRADFMAIFCTEEDCNQCPK